MSDYQSTPPAVYAIQNVGYMPGIRGETAGPNVQPVFAVPVHGPIWPVRPDGTPVDDDTEQHELALALPLDLAARLIAALLYDADKRDINLADPVVDEIERLRKAYP